MTIYIAMTMTGTCRNGAERDRGRLYHAVSGGVPPGGSWAKAACGAQPGKRSNGWSTQFGYRVTCPRCLKKLAADAKE